MTEGCRCPVCLGDLPDDTYCEGGPLDHWYGPGKLGIPEGHWQIGHHLCGRCHEDWPCSSTPEGQRIREKLA